MVLLSVRSSRLVGFIEPCLPSSAKVPSSGPDWIHEIKHGGFRIMARRDAGGVRLITRKGNDLTRRFPFIAMAVAALLVPSCLIDGEAIVSDDDGLAIFDRIRGHGVLASATLCAFDLLQVDGRDLRREPLEARKRALAKLLRRSHCSLLVNEHFRRRRCDCISKPAASAAKALYRSGWSRPTVPAAPRIGSRSRTRSRRP
jgi:bifunctional non-homologous end joining protein LigD